MRPLIICSLLLLALIAVSARAQYVDDDAWDNDGELAAFEPDYADVDAFSPEEGLIDEDGAWDLEDLADDVDMDAWDEGGADDDDMLDEPERQFASASSRGTLVDFQIGAIQARLKAYKAAYRILKGDKGDVSAHRKNLFSGATDAIKAINAKANSQCTAAFPDTMDILDAAAATRIIIKDRIESVRNQREKAKDKISRVSSKSTRESLTKSVKKAASSAITDLRSFQDAVADIENKYGNFPSGATNYMRKINNMAKDAQNSLDSYAKSMMLPTRSSKKILPSIADELRAATKLADAADMNPTKTNVGKAIDSLDRVSVMLYGPSGDPLVNLYSIATGFASDVADKSVDCAKYNKGSSTSSSSIVKKLRNIAKAADDTASAGAQNIVAIAKSI